MIDERIKKFKVGDKAELDLYAMGKHEVKIIDIDFEILDLETSPYPLSRPDIIGFVTFALLTNLEEMRVKLDTFYDMLD